MDLAHYPQQISSINTRTATFAIEELLNLSSSDLTAARVYADHQAYQAYLSQSSLFPSFQHATGTLNTRDVPNTSVHHLHPKFFQPFSSMNANSLLDSLQDNIGMNNYSIECFF